MNKLEELRAAYAATWPLSNADKDMMTSSQIAFYESTYNLMPTLLAAIQTLRDISGCSPDTEPSQVIDLSSHDYCNGYNGGLYEHAKRAREVLRLLNNET